MERLHANVSTDPVCHGLLRVLKVVTILVRRLPTRPQVLTRGGSASPALYLPVLGAAEALGERIQAVIRAAGWASILIAEILGDGAAWME